MLLGAVCGADIHTHKKKKKSLKRLTTRWSAAGWFCSSLSSRQDDAGTGTRHPKRASGMACRDPSGEIGDQVVGSFGPPWHRVPSFEESCAVPPWRFFSCAVERAEPLTGVPVCAYGVCVPCACGWLAGWGRASIIIDYLSFWRAECRCRR